MLNLRTRLRRKMQMISKIRDVLSLPQVSVCLMCERAATNDPFYERLVRDFYRDARRPHRKLFVIPRFCLGVALCKLPNSFEEYFRQIEAAARRNYKKAQRLGYIVKRIHLNDFLVDVALIRQSAPVRQGRSFSATTVSRCENPESRDPCHDYPYFGTMKDGRLYAYAGCFVAGEVCMIEHILGHADLQSDGVVPMLILDIARNLYCMHSDVKYYTYGTYFGASESMQRFKRKFLFTPHRVRWTL